MLCFCGLRSLYQLFLCVTRRRLRWVFWGRPAVFDLALRTTALRLESYMLDSSLPVWRVGAR